MIIVGMALFTLGSEQSMSQIGSLIGARLTKSRKLWLILALSFVMGVVITVAEPDLQVLATNVPGIDRGALIFTVSVGVGLFLAISMHQHGPHPAGHSPSLAASGFLWGSVPAHRLFRPRLSVGVL